MNDLQKHFIDESITKLKTLRQINAGDLSETVRRETFRALHTIKGTAQTFGFEEAGRIAHELENLLSAENPGPLLLEGFDELIKILGQKNPQISAQFIEKIHEFSPATIQKINFSESLVPEIPERIARQLSVQEKNSVVSAQASGQHFFILETGFDPATLAEDFKNFRAALSQKGEIIAALPCPKFSAAGKIGFQIILATSRNVEDLGEDFAPSDIFLAIAAHGRRLAEKSGKEIEFEISVPEEDLSPPHKKTIFDILLHLVRNAVDHAVEKQGKIEISLKSVENRWCLTVSDDGKGVDLEKVRAQAVEKNLISEDDVLNTQETIELIFASELSTAGALTEISGRGLGLDAVKDAVEKLNGKIRIETRKGFGTKFEIFLPSEKI